MLITVRSFPTTQRLHSFKFTWSTMPFTTLWGCCPLLRTPFSNFVRMRTQSLVPRPTTTVISLEARLVHRRKGQLPVPYIDSRFMPVRMAGTVFSPAALGKAYEHHVGKVLPTCSYTENSLLTALVNCKARMVSCQYDSFLCCSWSVVMTTESWNWFHKVW